MTSVRLSATLVTLNFDYVSCVLRPRLVANVNNVFRRVLNTERAMSNASVVSYCFCKHAAA